MTGANFLIAENSSTVIVTNEGNGDLTKTNAKVHIVIASIEKFVPTLEDVSTLIRLLPRSASGQEITNYFTFRAGAKPPEDLDGHVQFHVILLYTRRSDMLNTELHEILRCFRCCACLNLCPVMVPLADTLTDGLIRVQWARY